MVKKLLRKGKQGSKSKVRDKCIPLKQVKFADGMRKLWIDHAIWTRNVIMSIVSDLPDTDVALKRLLDNQQDIGDYIKPYYGTAAGDQLANLLKDHIKIAGQLVTAAKEGNQSDVDKYNQLWYANADEIVAFLAKANPYLSASELKKLFHVHLQQVFAIASAMLKGDWQGSIDAFDMGLNHIIRMADYLSAGIIRQFPKQFK